MKSSICVVLALTACLNPTTQAPTIAEKDAPSKIVIAAKQEPGERLTLTGRVLKQDGVTPVAAASVYVYHTDAKGYYTPGVNDNRNPRLRGYMRTDAQGRMNSARSNPVHIPTVASRHPFTTSSRRRPTASGFLRSSSRATLFSTTR